MIDTITLGTIDFSIQPSNKLIKRIDINQETGEVSEKYFLNSDPLYLTIDNKGLRFHFSFCKIYGLKDNFYPLGVNSFFIILENLKKILYDIGIISDLNTFKILRLDIFKNVMTNKNFYAYSTILRSLELKRTHKRDYVDGFLSSNSYREICFYNKVRELSEKLGTAYVKQVYNFQGENIIRGELRLLKHREVKKNNIIYLKEIPEKWSYLKEIYIDYLKKVFKYEHKGGDVKLDSETLEALIEYSIKVLKQKGKEALKIFGFYPFFFVNRDELLSSLKEHYSKSQAFNILTKIEKSKREYGEIYKTYDYKKLYSELKEKFLSL